jgi:hypothetical protein
MKKINLIKGLDKYGHITLQNIEVDGQLLWSNDKERDLLIYIILFGYTNRYEEKENGIVVVDDYIFCPNPTDLYDILQSIVQRNTTRHKNNEENYQIDINEWKNCIIKPKEDLYKLFPELDVQTSRKLDKLLTDYYDNT